MMELFGEMNGEVNLCEFLLSFGFDQPGHFCRVPCLFIQIFVSNWVVELQAVLPSHDQNGFYSVCLLSRFLSFSLPHDKYDRVVYYYEHLFHTFHKEGVPCSPSES